MKNQKPKDCNCERKGREAYPDSHVCPKEEPHTPISPVGVSGEPLTLGRKQEGGGVSSEADDCPKGTDCECPKDIPPQKCEEFKTDLRGALNAFENGVLHERQRIKEAVFKCKSSEYEHHEWELEIYGAYDMVCSHIGCGQKLSEVFKDE